MVDHKAVKLGKKAARRDERTLLLENYVTLPSPKSSVLRSPVVPDWGMMLNDREGDCTCAGWGHLKLLRTTLAKSPVRMTDDQVQSLYIMITSNEGAAFNPATGDNDNGCVELDVLNFLRKQGEIGAYTAIVPTNFDHVKFAIDAFEGVYMGCGLPLSAQGQDYWDISNPGDSTMGSWGGHCMIVVDYDASGVTFVTWGGLQKASWAWWSKYVDEAYAIISKDMMSTVIPSGFDIDTLKKDISAL